MIQIDENAKDTMECKTECLLLAKKPKTLEALKGWDYPKLSKGPMVLWCTSWWVRLQCCTLFNFSDAKNNESYRKSNLEKIKKETGRDFTFEMDFGAIYKAVPKDDLGDQAYRLILGNVAEEYERWCSQLTFR